MFYIKDYKMRTLFFAPDFSPRFLGLENPLPPVAAGHSIGQRACHRAASQVLHSPKFGLQTLLSFNSPTFKIILLTSYIPRKSIHQLVAVMDPRTTQGDSLLHLSVSKSNTLKTQVSKSYAALD